MRKLIFTLLTVLAFTINNYGQVFVSTTGSDTNIGSIDNPYATITKAISIAQAGDTIYVRGGTYSLSATISVSSSKSGSESKRYYLFGYKDERPLLDFSTEAFGKKGIQFNASFWHIKGLDIKGAGDNGIEISGGSYNRIEFCSFFENRDSGMQLSNGAAFNEIINCDSYYNADPADYGDADGFAPKLTVGTGNYFYGCRSWGNCDDGWDGYMRGSNDITTTLENCWTFGNGYLKDGTDPGPQANGNGFKMGGGDNSNSLHLMHHHILKNCLAFNNKVKGFDQNNNDGSMTLLNCTGFNNLSANFRITRQVNDGQTVTVKNCISLNGNVDLGSFVIQEADSWISPLSVSESDFKSIIPSDATAPRKADGSLPDIDFMHLNQNSGLVDAGVDVGLPYTGKAPDLGAFEYGIPTAIEDDEIPSSFILSQNYPNPFNPSTKIQFSVPSAETRRGLFLQQVSVKIYDLLGRELSTLLNKELLPGKYSLTFNAAGLPSGIYFYKLSAGNFSSVKKMILMK